MPAPDVVVVGGGPAGLAAAIAARLRGLAVTLFERQRPPIDKACGEGLMPAGVAALARLGVRPPERSFPFRGIRYLADGVAAEGDFPDGERGAGVRRTELHAALVARARELGVELRFGEAVESVSGCGPGGTPMLARTARGEQPARFVVGADGLRSRLRREHGLARPVAADEAATSPRARFGISRHFRGRPWSDRVEVSFGDRAEAYVTPLADDEIGVAILWSDFRGGFDELLAARFPAELGRRLGALARVAGDRDRGAGPFRQRVTHRTRGALALVGDAGGYVDALTGEGLSLAFEQALALGAALAEGDLARYEREARRLAALPDRWTAFALAGARRPWLRRRFVAAMARDPALFGALLGTLGARRPFAPASVLRLLRGLAHPPRRLPVTSPCG